MHFSRTGILISSGIIFVIIEVISLIWIILLVPIIALSDLIVVVYFRHLLKRIKIVVIVGSGPIMFFIMIRLATPLSSSPLGLVPASDSRIYLAST